MEGSEESHVPKPDTDEEKHIPQQHQQRLGLGLGLDSGFQPSPLLDADPNLDQKVSSEAVHAEKLFIDRELESLESITQELEILRLVMDTISDMGIVEFPNPPETNEEFSNLVLEEKEKVIESEAIEKGIARELDVEEQDRDAKGDSKSEVSADDGEDGDFTTSESEKEDDRRCQWEWKCWRRDWVSGGF